MSYGLQISKVLIVMSFISLLTSSAQTQAQQKKNPANSHQQATEFIKLNERIWFLTNTFDEMKDVSKKQEQSIKELFVKLQQTNSELNITKNQQIQRDKEPNLTHLKQTNDELNELKYQLNKTNDQLMQAINQLKRTDDELKQQKQIIEKLQLTNDQQTETENELKHIKTQLKQLNESRDCQCKLPSIEVRTLNSTLVNGTQPKENITPVIPEDMCQNGGSPVFKSNSSDKMKNDCVCAPRFRGNRCELNCTFNGEAGVDLPGGPLDISKYPEPDVNRCLDKCTATPNCLSVMHNGGNNNCILKSENSSTKDKSHFIVTAKENVLYTIICN